MGQAALLTPLPSAVTGSHVAPVLAQDKLLCDKHGCDELLLKCLDECPQVGESFCVYWELPPSSVFWKVTSLKEPGVASLPKAAVV